MPRSHSQLSLNSCYSHDDPLSTFKDSILLTRNAKYVIHSSDYMVNQFISRQTLCFNHRGVKSKGLKARLQQQQQQRSTKRKTFCSLMLSLCVRHMYSTSRYAFPAQLLCKTSDGIPLHKTSFILYNPAEVQTSVLIASNYHNPRKVIAKQKIQRDVDSHQNISMKTASNLGFVKCNLPNCNH